MKKTLLAFFLTVSLLVSLAVLPVSAEGKNSITIDFGTSDIAGYGTSQCTVDGDAGIEGGAMMVKQTLGGGWGTREPQGENSFFGCRRNALYAVPTLPAGEYTVTVYLGFKDGTLFAEGNPNKVGFSPLLTFTKDKADAALMYEWETQSVAYASLFTLSNTTPSEGKTAGLTKAEWEEASVEDENMLPWLDSPFTVDPTTTEANGKTWYKLTADITLESEANQICIWSYVPGYLQNEYVADGFYFDNMTITNKDASAVLGDAETEPAATEPAATEPAATEPAATQPTATEPAGTEPAGTDAPTAEPTGMNPIVIVAIVAAVVIVVVAVVVIAKKKKA